MIMTQEEKLEEAKRLYETANADQRYVLESLFPELKESEDERIRKCLIDLVNGIDTPRFYGVDRKAAIVWLEKQGEHAKFRDSIQVGDKVTRNEDGVLVNLSQLNRVAKKDEKQGEQNQETNYPKFDFDDILAIQYCMETAKKVTEDKELYEKLQSLHNRLHDAYWIGKQGEKSNWKPSKDEMDALYGLSYITNKMDDKKDEAITKLYQDLKREFFDGASYENMFPSSPVDAPIKDEKQGEQKPMKTCAEYYNKDSELKMPELSVFQNKLADILMQREYEGSTETEEDVARARLDYELAAIRISEELLPLAIMQKPAEWSEEDEKMFEHIIAKATLHFCSINYLDEEEINFLKSLRPQNTWKPSERQKEALLWCVIHLGGADKQTLGELLEELNKL